MRVSSGVMLDDKPTANVYSASNVYIAEVCPDSCQRMELAQVLKE